MRRIDTATKKEIQDKNGKSFDGFVERDPREGEQSTNLSDSWCNNLQEEICNVIEGIGNSVNKEMTVAQDGSKVREEKYDQMLQAIKLLAETGTPIGSVKPMSVKMNPNFIARWVPAKRSEKGAMYLSEEMATNCEQVEGTTAGWYKLVTGDKQSGEGSGAFGWALADGKFPLPIELFGEYEEPPAPEEKLISTRIYKDDLGLEMIHTKGEVLSDTEYGKMWRYEYGGRYYFGGNDKTGWGAGYLSNVLNTDYISVDIDYETNMFQSSEDCYPLKDEDYFSRKSSSTTDDEDVWADNPKPKLIPNLNDKAFLMGSNEENLPLTVEGKNGFMMQPYHMPPHTHILSPHDHDMFVALNDNNRPESTRNFLRWDVLTSTYNSSYTKDYKTQPSDHICTKPTGGYVIYRDLHNEKGDMEDKYLYGNVPIDLRPKRMQVYYYIRVI